MEGAIKLEYEIERENIGEGSTREEHIWTRSTGSEEIFRKGFVVLECIVECERGTCENTHLFLIE